MGAQDPSSIPWDPNSTSFPTIDQLPKIPDAPTEAAWVWGKDDYVGRINLLTPTRVSAAAKEIKTGALVTVNLPLTVPAVPAFGRQPFSHSIKTLAPSRAYDDIYEMNTQSGTQFDGFRHFAHLESGNFYNGTKGEDIEEKGNHKCSVHHWANHGVAGRGILVDYWGYAHKMGKEYDPFGHTSISLANLTEAAKDQGLDLRPEAKGGDVKIGDILMVRSGWVDAYYKMDSEKRDKLGQRHSGLGDDNETYFSGIGQGRDMVEWLHDCYFAAVAGDAPSFEAWPSKEKYFLHEYCLALWGMPIGEMFDLEKLAETCRKEKRWTFFFTAAPANMPGGVGTHVNGTAIF